MRSFPKHILSSYVLKTDVTKSGDKEWGMENEEWRKRNGEWRMRNGEKGMENEE